MSFQSLVDGPIKTFGVGSICPQVFTDMLQRSPSFWKRNSNTQCPLHFVGWRWKGGWEENEFFLVCPQKETFHPKKCLNNFFGCHPLNRMLRSLSTYVGLPTFKSTEIPRRLKEATSLTASVIGAVTFITLSRVCLYYRHCCQYIKWIGW